MPKELKIFFIILFVLPVFAFTYLIFRTNKPDSALANINGLSQRPESYELGDIPRLGGLVIRNFVIKNTTDKSMKLSRITTSCMCTKAKVIVDNQETKLFGMEGMGDKNPPVNLTLNPNQEAKVMFEFDPNAHGPKGVGPIDRSIQLIFSDPQAIKELKFKGVVIEK